MEKLLIEYKKLYSFKMGYWKDINKNLISAMSVVGIIIPLGVFIFLRWLGIGKQLSIFSSIYIGLIIGFFISIKMLNYEIKRINKKIYGTNIKNNVYLLKKRRFIESFRDLGIDIYNKEQMEYLLKLLDNHIHKLKPKKFIEGGVLAAILLPLWNEYIKSVFIELSNNPQEAFGFSIAISSLIGILIILFYAFKTSALDMYRSIFCSKYYSYKEMKEKIEEIYLYTLNKDNFKKEIIQINKKL